VLKSTNNELVLIDPAVHYGHREAEIAFTSLFGGFSDIFYHAYNEIFPLESGFKQRRALYQLYPILVHLNLFGSGYVGQARSIIKQFV
jgi:fructosamine-3-kinase